mgnify:CR=1 FL=1
MKMTVDLHNHTVLCNHAQGTIHEYIEQAIKHKTKVYGFSEHAPMDFDPKYRLSFEEMQEYTSLVLQAKEKYKDQIEILLAYEVDYLEGHMDERSLIQISDPTRLRRTSYASFC